MQRAIDLANLGAGHVSPNPLVGAVIVHDNRIIGEGWHQQYGHAHAEIEALKRVKDQSLLGNSTMYVTLEPCNHYGKTPPCTGAIISSGIKKVVVGITDPNPLVAGTGIATLRSNGIDVIENVLAGECAELNKRFITFITKKRPYIILKWAETKNGFIAPDRHSLSDEEFEKQRHITGLTTQKLTHKWRTEEDSLMVGTNTILTDNPRLNARAWNGKNPVRVIIDLNCRLADGLNIFDNSQKTFIFNNSDKVQSSSGNETHFYSIEPTRPVIGQALDKLYDNNIQSLIVEGGTYTLQSFITAGLWDEAQVLISPKMFDSGVKAPIIGGTLKEQFSIDQNTIHIIKP